MSFLVIPFRFSSFCSLPAAFLGLSFLLASCEVSHDAIIDSIHPSPSVISASVSPTAVNTDSMNVGPFQLPEDVLTISLLATIKIGHPSPSLVGYALYEDYRSEPLAAGELNDLGLPPDETASDSIYSGRVTFHINRSFIGNLIVELVPKSNSGTVGTAFLQTVQIQRFNNPPTLSQLQAPDTVRTSLMTEFVVSVQANDPDGISDVATVTRQTPAGSLWNLNDSGVNGDLVAGDGIYTETVSLSPPPSPGSYTFVFRALDQSSATSNTIQHTIVVVQ